MSYLDKTMAEMKGKITFIYEALKNAETDKDTAKHMDKLEKYIRGKLVESFKNGVEIGTKEAKGGKKWKDRK